MRKYHVLNCNFVENHADKGGAINIQFSEYASVENCRFTRNSATWEGGAIYDVNCNNCTFIENTADYGGAMKSGTARNCTFSANHANFGGASYNGACLNSSFIENYADYGGAIYESWRTEDCRFIGNYAFFGGAIYRTNVFATKNCYFAYNFARNGGAVYQVEAENCFFANNEATEYGGAMYGESATNCSFQDNKANTGNDTFNTEILESGSNITNSSYIIYFDADAAFDGDGSKNNPYKYLYPGRISSVVTAYFAEGTYELNSTCTITGARLIGEGNVRIDSKVSNQYDFIIKENSYLELKNIQFQNMNILNQGTLNVKDSYFEGTDLFDPHNLPEIESGSGLFDSSYGGVIVCDSPASSKSALILDGCHFQRVYDAFNGGAIAAINSDISISNTVFFQYSSTYKGGAIYCINSNLNLYNGRFTPFTISEDEDSTVTQYGAYTSYYGGSIYCENSNMFIDRSNFDGSVSFSFGGCIASLNSNITIRESSFNNSASLADGGGAIYNSKSELYIFDSKLFNNSAEFGGAICNINSILNSYHSTYSDNHANYYGGAIYDIYGTMNFYTNWFYLSRALAGGAIYTRIPNELILQTNSFGDSFAKEGSSIFYDGKKENVISNSYSNDYHVFAEFHATLNGKDYYLISNPIYYQLSSYTVDHLYYPYPVYEVYDGPVTMMIRGTDDDSNLTSIATHDAFNNISVNINFSEEFVNPTLNVYLFEGHNIELYRKGLTGNRYSGSRDNLFNKYNLIGNYSIDLSDSILNGNYNFTGPCTVDFGNSFLKIKYDNLYQAASFNPVSLINNSFLDYTNLPSQIDVLSSYYNSNDYGFVSTVKDQKNGGNCWAFSGIATLETCLSKATGVKYDFSEENAKNLMAAYSVYGIKIETNHAGYESMLLSYLTSWLGPINEDIENYDDYSSISILESPMFHIQNVKFLPARLDSSDNDLYKLAIRDNGAVSVTFKWGDDFHSVSLVGWDDNYVGYDSLGKLANGAWIFKNSWGPDWENNGFGYLSYDEKISEQIYPNLHAYTFVFNDNNPYTKIYQYDFAGVSEFYHYMDSISFKNTFTVEDDCLLSAFSTYFDSQTNFTVSVYKNNQFVFSQNGTASAGYFTIPFTTPIQLDKGDEFSIAINNHNKGYNCIPVCSAEEITKKTFSQNVSFISLDGENWFDLYDYADSCNVACIKAFTQNINLTNIKINIDEFDSVNTKNFNIKVDLDNVDVNAINYCLVKFIIDGNTYYAQIRNGEAILNVNLEEGNHSLSAQYKDNLFESNIIKFNFTVKHDASSQSFNALQDLINNAEEKANISLNHDYIYDERFDDGEYGVRITKTITIDGNGHVIDGLLKATGFYVSARDVVLNNIIFNNTFSTNGGGAYIAARNVTLNNCTFINSMATQYGGGIYSLFDINLNDCKFINDTANMGGGLYLITSNATNIKNCYFNNNNAYLHGSAVYIDGIGNCIISSTNFTDNIAKYNGGAVFSIVYQNNFTECLFKNNSANSGGAVFSNAYLNDFRGCVFTDNNAEKSGGAISSHNKINITDSDFINNRVTTWEQFPFGGFGGGAIYSYDDLKVYNSIFTNNSAGEGGALYTSKYLKIYKSKFINNTASASGGSVYTSNWMMMKTNMGILLFSDANIYDSYFDNNNATRGGALYSVKLADNCTFVNNHAKYGGAIYNINTVESSNFKNNFAEISGGAIYEVKTTKNSNYINNSAKYGGAVYFENTGTVTNCNFTLNYATEGGAIHIPENTISTIENSRFDNNSAQYGGAIITYTDTEENMASISISKNSFTSNNANMSGGAIYSDGLIYIESSNFENNTANWGSAIFSVAYLNLTDSNITSNQNITPLQFMYHYINETSVYGDLYLKNNKINSPAGAIYYNENEIAYKSLLFLVFNNTQIIKGQNVNVAHIEDMDGNIFNAYGTGDLIITLTDQNNNRVRFTLAYDTDLGGYLLDTSSINYGTYRLDGKLSNNYPGCIAKPATLTVTDANGRTSPAILPSEITAEYGKDKKLTITLQDMSGNAISNSAVKVNFNGKSVTLTTNRNGQVSVDYKLVPGTYIASISFNGNNKYKATSKMMTVTVKKATPKIIASKKTFKVKVKTKKYTVTIKNNLGKAMKKVKVTIKIKGKTYKATTNSQGKATFKLKLAKKGKFKATVKYAGNKYYNKISKKVKITVK